MIRSRSRQPARCQIRFGAGDLFYVLASLLSTDTYRFGSSPGGIPLLVSGPQDGFISEVAGQQITIVPNATITLTAGNPGTVLWPNHPCVAGSPIVFETTGNLLGPLAPGQIYYVSSANIQTGSFTIAADQADALAAAANLIADLPDADIPFAGS